MARTNVTSLHGELQLRVMGALWRLGDGTVEDVRAALPPSSRGAYTTVQTVLNRLAERDLLSRSRRGNTIRYRPRLTEAEYISRSIRHTLAGASSGARQTALASLIGDLDADALSEVRRMAGQVDQRRGSGS